MRIITAFTNRLGNRNNNQDRCLVLERRNSALLVVADGMSSQAEIEGSLRQLPSGSNLIGTVLNKAPMDTVFPYYGYGSGYPASS